MALGPLGQIHITVTDIERSVAFYRDVLQIPLLSALPDQSRAFFASGDVRLYLGVAESPEFVSRVVVYFTVDDIQAEHARLAAAGADMVNEPHPVQRDGSGVLWMSFLRDPDGHHIAIMQSVPD